MNDLEYRRRQLLKLQDTVIDLEDLSSGISIADLTLTDFRIDLAQYLKTHPGVLENLPLGTCAVTTTTEADVTDTTAASGDVPEAQEPGDLGDDAELDALAQECFEGDFGACDQLFFDSPIDSDYEAYGDSCGGRNEPGGLCVTLYGQG